MTMRISGYLLAIGFFLVMAGAGAQETQRLQKVEAQPATQAMKVRPLKDIVRDVEAQNVGVCLKGKKAKLVRKRSETTNCDSVFWVEARSWSGIQRELRQTSRDSISAGQGSTRKCSSCSGTCQIVSWFSGGSKYEGVDVGGGQSPSECIDAVKKLCESGASRFMSSAQCGS